MLRSNSLIDKSFPKWVPVDAQNRLNDLYKNEVDRPLLEKLSGKDYVNMRDVWTKLPQKGREGLLIDLVLNAYRRATNFELPKPKNKKDWEAWAERVCNGNEPPLFDATFIDVSTYAEMLRDNMLKLQSHAEVHWPELWQGDPETTFDKVISDLKNIKSFYEKLETRHQTLVSRLDKEGFPKPPTKRGYAKAQQVDFSHILSWGLEKLYGKPLDEVSATIEAVVFGTDTDGEFSGTTTRGRRRPVKKEHSAKKRR